MAEITTNPPAAAPTPAPDAAQAAPAETAAPLPPFDPTTPGQRVCDHRITWQNFHAGRPNDVSIYVQPTYDFFRNMAGIPDGVYITPIEKDAYGNYSFTAGGPMTGYNMGPEFSAGLDYRRYARYESPKHPHREMYQQVGPRFSLSAAFGTYHLTDYSFTGTASTQQISDKWGVTQYQLENAAGDAIYGDFSGFASLLTMIPSLWGDYDFTQDFYGTPTETYRDVPYYRVMGTVWAGGGVYNASIPVNAFESAHIGLNVGMMGMDDVPYGGIGLAAEMSALRFSPPSQEQNVRADLLLNASATYYREMGAGPFLDSDFWGDGHLIDAQAGVALRVSTDVPRLHVAKPAPAATSDEADAGDLASYQADGDVVDKQDGQPAGAQPHRDWSDFDFDVGEVPAF